MTEGELSGFHPSAMEAASGPSIDEAAESALSADATDAAWTRFAATVENRQFTSIAPRVREALARALDHPSVAPTRLARAVASACLLESGTAALASTVSTLDPAKAIDGLAAIFLRDELKSPLDPLLLGLARAAVIVDPRLEAILTAARRALLEITVQARAWSPAAIDTALALAEQGFLNEYAWAEDDFERAAVARVVTRLVESNAGSERPSAVLPILVACYRPLAGVAGARSLAERDWPEPVAGLLGRQILEPLAEIDRAARIPSVTSITDPVSREVAEHYTVHPYPRWSRPGAVSPSPSDEPAPRRILIAGCGTGWHAVAVATRYPGATMLAIDLSATSLAFAARRAEALGLERIRFARADILRLDEIGERFDLIESGGVIHHMADPAAAWRGLAALLEPGGRMMVAVYSAAARRSLDATRARLVSPDGRLPETSVEIVRARRRLLIERAWTADEPALQSSDFYATSACRDLLFHAHEKRFTLPGITKIIADAGLRFTRLDVPAPIRAAFRARFPSVGSESSLECWDAFEREAPESFRGMYRVWCEKPREADGIGVQAGAKPHQEHRPA